jgi:MFS family permease
MAHDATVSLREQEVPAEEKTTPLKAWLLVSVLVTFYIFAVMDRAIISMLVDPIRDHFNINDTQVALLMGLAYAAAYAAGGLPMGYLVDKLPRKWLLFVAVCFWGLAEAACGVATGFVGLFIARMCAGLGESPLNPSAHSMIADTFPKRRLATAMSVYGMGALLGTGVALIVGGWIVNALSAYEYVTVPLLGQVKPWQLVFIITGLPGLVLALLIIPFREPPRAHQHGAASDASWGELFRFLGRHWKVVVGLSVIFGGMNIVNGALIKWQPAYLSRYFHLNPAEYGTALGLIYAGAGVAGLLFSGWLVDFLYSKGRKNAHLDYYMWAVIVSTPIVVIGLLSPNLKIYLATATLAKFATVNFMGVAGALVQMISPPRLRGRLSAIFFLMIIALLGTTFGPLIPAVISDYVIRDEVRMGRSLAMTLLIMAPLAVVAMVWIRRPLQLAIAENNRD